jgi:hypothetical protein
MTPQSSFTIVANIKPERKRDLKELLASMNVAPGQVDPLNPIIPFRHFANLHFARCVILDDLTIADITAYGLPAPSYPTHFIFLGDVDGDAEPFMKALAERAGTGLATIFEHCEGFSPGTEMFSWLKNHNLTPSANYVNWIGRTVRQVDEEEALYREVRKYVQDNLQCTCRMQAHQIHEAIKMHVSEEQREGRIKISENPPTPLGWKIRNFIHLASIPLAALFLLPIALITLPFFLIMLRSCERSDPEIAPRVDPDHAALLAAIEDHDVTNSFNAMGGIKPGWFRLMTMRLVLLAIDYTVRHIFNRGRLARVTSIQFARWVFLDDNKRMIFASNYDGSLESYMDDFINKVAFGLNVVFSNGVGYPRTNWLVEDGAKDEQTFKNVLRRHQVPSDVWYNAHPGLTALDKRRNSLVAESLRKPYMSDSDAQAWLGLL